MEMIPFLLAVIAGGCTWLGWIQGYNTGLKDGAKQRDATKGADPLEPAHKNSGT